MPTLTLVVMAAGIGSRYGGLKQLDPVGPGGEALLEYSVYDAVRAGFDRVVFIIRKEIEAPFREKTRAGLEKAAETTFVFQALEALPAGFAVPGGRTKPWGTAQAILACREAVRTPFCVINADDFYGASAFETMAGHLRRRRETGQVHDYAMIGYRLENTLSEFGHVARGVCEATPDGDLVDIHELFKIQRFPDGIKHTVNGRVWLPLRGDSPTSMNFWGFRPSLFDELERRFPEFLRQNAAKIGAAEFLIPEVVGALVREKLARVKILPTQERWFGITYTEDRPVVQAAIRDRVRKGVYPAPLWP